MVINVTDYVILPLAIMLCDTNSAPGALEASVLVSQANTTLQFLAGTTTGGPLGNGGVGTCQLIITQLQ
jgi:hypothetical protein